MRVQFIAISQNAKTGPIPASIVERAVMLAGLGIAPVVTVLARAYTRRAVQETTR